MTLRGTAAIRGTAGVRARAGGPGWARARDSAGLGRTVLSGVPVPAHVPVGAGIAGVMRVPVGAGIARRTVGAGSARRTVG